MTQSIPMVTVGKKWDKGAVYIGRGSPFGNPFPIPSNGREDLRDSACDKYDHAFWNNWLHDEAFTAALESLVQIAKLEGKLILGCYCAPKRCHGETIKKYVDQRLSGELQLPERLDKVGFQLKDLL